MVKSPFAALSRLCSLEGQSLQLWFVSPFGEKMLGLRGHRFVLAAGFDGAQWGPCRYRQAVGRFAVHPLDGRRIPIMADAVLVDMAFGTGAVKITPAHDPNDFDTGRRHGLKHINLLTDDGRINHEGRQFQGLPRFQVCCLPSGTRLTQPAAAKSVQCCWNGGVSRRL